MKQERVLDGFPLTFEQNAIVDAVHRGISLKILAFAGTGKTTTLRAIAHFTKIPNTIYITYNSAIAREAKETFPHNVRCMTAHGLAFRNVLNTDNWKKKFAAANNGSRVPAKVIYDVCKLPSYHSFTRSTKFQLSVFVTATLNMFLQSADKKVKSCHVPPEVFAAQGDPRKARVKAFIKEIRDYTRIFWEAMSDENNTCPMTHDAYLKIYQLRKPKINANLIMVDEAQDINPVLEDIIANQTVQKIFVGDNHQQIYAWRGAVNALAKLDYEEFNLTQSFRFGPKIAEMANACLFAKGEDIRIVGAGKKSTNFDSNKPYTFLTRSNGVLFSELIRAIDQNKKVHVVGDLATLLRLFEGAYWLWIGDPFKCQAPELKPFKDWYEFLDYVEYTEDKEFTRVVKFIDKYQHRTLKMCERVRLYPSTPEHRADLVLSTIHRSKGREWLQVMFANDIEMPDKDEIPHTDEINLIYVGLTRGIRALCVSDAVEEDLYNYIVEMKKEEIKAEKQAS